jgi:hypothetical protein
MELVEELVSVAMGVLVAVVLVLECLKSGLDGVVLGLDVSKESSCQVSVLLDVTIDLSLERFSLVCGTSILSTDDLFSESNTGGLLGFLPLAKPVNGGGSLGNLWCGHVVDVLLNGVDVFVIEVVILWALVVRAWFVSLVAILVCEELLEVCNLLIN